MTVIQIKTATITFSLHQLPIHHGLDGVILVYDPSQPHHEAELEKMYTIFAQPNRLTTSLCMTLAISHTSGTGSTGMHFHEQISFFLLFLPQRACIHFACMLQSVCREASQKISSLALLSMCP